MKVQITKCFSQRDQNWSYKLIGADNTETIGRSGCLITCLAMISSYFGKDTNPDKMNQDLQAANSFQGALYKWGGEHLIYGDIQEKKANTPSLLNDGQLNEIKSMVDNGYPVMVALNCVTYYHYVVLTDYDQNDENSWMIANPWTGNIEFLQQYYTPSKPNFRIIVEQYALYSGPKPVIVDPKDTQIQHLTQQLTDANNKYSDFKNKLIQFIQNN